MFYLGYNYLSIFLFFSKIDLCLASCVKKCLSQMGISKWYQSAITNWDTAYFFNTFHVFTSMLASRSPMRMHTSNR